MQFEVWLHISAHSPTQWAWSWLYHVHVIAWASGRRSQPHLKPHPIILPDRPGLTDFFAYVEKTQEGLDTRPINIASIEDVSLISGYP